MALREAPELPEFKESQELYVEVLEFREVLVLRELPQEGEEDAPAHPGSE